MVFMANTMPPPDPDDRPGNDVVIYDGQCRFCTAQVQRLARWDRAGRLTFLSLHDSRTGQRYPELSQAELMEQMYLMTADGQRYAGAGAVRYMSRKMRRLWLLAPLLHIPFSLPLWQWLYRLVAKHRYRLGAVDSCDDGSCDVHLR
jgi:predicted DCC family thiol-disulfide oxidoreductase YuxK